MCPSFFSIFGFPLPRSNPASILLQLEILRKYFALLTVHKKRPDQNPGPTTSIIILISNFYQENLVPCAVVFPVFSSFALTGFFHACIASAIAITP